MSKELKTGKRKDGLLKMYNLLNKVTPTESKDLSICGGNY